jgi:hypothetical protein
VDTDDLLRPALTGYRRTGYRPWRLQSQIYVAFFGGALALGAIALANSVMLGMPRRKQLAIAGAALLAEAALVVVVALTSTGALRLGGVAAGLAAYGPAYLLQRSPDRVHHFHAREDDPYDSLFGPGLVAVIVARLVEAFALGAIVDP